VNGKPFSDQPRSTMNRRNTGQLVAAILFGACLAHPNMITERADRRPVISLPSPSRPGTDRFRIAVSGENRRQRGSSVIAVEVTIR